MALKVSNKNRKKTEIFECIFPTEEERLGNGTKVTELPGDTNKKVEYVDVGDMELIEALKVLDSMTGSKLQKTYELENLVFMVGAVGIIVIFIGILLFL